LNINLLRPYGKVQQVTGELDFDYTNGPVALHGVVSLNWPCGSSSNSSLVSGSVSVTVSTKAVGITDARVTVAYACGVDATLHVDGRALH